LLPYISFEKYINILALKIASLGNQHCANGALSFPIASRGNKLIMVWRRRNRHNEKRVSIAHCAAVLQQQQQQQQQRHLLATVGARCRRRLASGRSN